MSNMFPTNRRNKTLVYDKKILEKALIFKVSVAQAPRGKGYLDPI